jgi:chemotaxis protein CheX
MSTTPTSTASISKEEWIGYVHASLDEVFGMMLGMKITPCEDVAVVSQITAIVGLAGSLCGLFGIRCSRESGAKMAEKMLGPPEGNSQILDALGEICNMLAGSFKSRIPSIADTCMLSIPTTIDGADYHIHALGGGKRFEMLVKCDEELMQVILQVNS